ncbi:hypothetical protein Taro_048221 [Colocasia esculenta]|uniref:CRM-domain containing factor CFM3, chloroplastic/mitochondrial n=1 Tax=Colocasia esculenta TaxID=4460 RepID=A0A843X4Y5_COLES|nr:hypothetical protein [Colocasia esculenta]
MLLSRPHPCPSPPSLNPRQFSSPPPPLLPHAPVVPPRKLPSRCRLRASLSPSQEVLPKSAIQKIAEKLRSLGYLEEGADEVARGRTAEPTGGIRSAGEIFIPTPQELPRRRVGHTIDPSWSTPESPVPLPGSSSAIARFHELRRELGMDTGRVARTPTPPMVAELTVPAEELRRLRCLGIRLDKKLRLKVGKAGITEGIVNSIHERWRRSQLVKIKCEDLCRMNMKRTHETLERKTGGLVIWRSGTIIILYRGADYKYPYFTVEDLRVKDIDKSSSESTVVTTTDNTEEDNSSFLARVASSGTETCISSHSLLVAGVGSPNKVRFQLPSEVQLGEEADELLEGLGPRFTDWWSCHPLPVDADLLPAVVPGYRKPFRLLPFGLKPKLTDQEMTILRRLGRPLPCHFALGRNRNLQGLALSMIKLWEKCEIAKIAIKRGARNTNTELMVEELKRLTGGTLLSRDKDYIIFYRGKDFLPSAVSSAIEQRRNFEMHKHKHNLEESSSTASRADARLISSIDPIVDARLSIIGPASTNGLQDGNENNTIVIKANRLKAANQAVEKMQAKLSRALEKKEKAEELLEELEQSIGPSKSELDKEAISEEERFMLRKVGLRMKAFLLLGRRGVFDGTVENMHLHWKYRELVKIISKDRCIENVHRAAWTLEAASGGILVAVERVNKGYAIIVYRGKNYRRPAVLRPRALLNKKEALKHSLEAQRHQSLKLHVLKLSGDIKKMSRQLEITNAELVSASSMEHENSSSVVETTDHSGSMELKYESISEVDDYQSDVKPMSSTEQDDASGNMEETDNLDMLREPLFTSDSEKDGLVDSYDEDGFSMVETVSSFSESDLEMNVLQDETKYNSILSSSKGKDFQQQLWVPSSISDNSSLVQKPSSESELSDHGHKDDKKGERNNKFVVLSNKERLILRKQALKMKKQPVFAIGRNNVITGVANAITAHFEKYPLAIVNVKGRAKGTSVQELVFELEQATGAVMVSREPNKVILYRGWDKQHPLRARENGISVGTSDSISPQLMAAISLEYGVPASQDEDITLSRF